LDALDSSDGITREAELAYPAGRHSPAGMAASAAGPRTATSGYTRMQNIKFPLKTYLCIYFTSMQEKINPAIEKFGIMLSFTGFYTINQTNF